MYHSSSKSGHDVRRSQGQDDGDGKYKRRHHDYSDDDDDGHRKERKGSSRNHHSSSSSKYRQRNKRSRSRSRSRERHHRRHHRKDRRSSSSDSSSTSSSGKSDGDRRYKDYERTSKDRSRNEEEQLDYNRTTNEVQDPSYEDSSYTPGYRNNSDTNSKSTSQSAMAPGISIKLAAPPVPKPSLPVSTPKLVPKLSKVAAIFNDDDDDEVEEMPPECKMRMKNVGRDTPTSAGPNSFGKTKLGFCNTTHITEKKLEAAVLGPGKLPKRK